MVQSGQDWAAYDRGGSPAQSTQSLRALAQGWQANRLPAFCPLWVILCHQVPCPHPFHSPDWPESRHIPIGSSSARHLAHYNAKMAATASASHARMSTTPPVGAAMGTNG